MAAHHTDWFRRNAVGVAITYSAKSAARVLGIPTTTIYNWVSIGVDPSFDIADAMVEAAASAVARAGGKHVVKADESPDTSRPATRSPSPAP